MFKLFSVAFKNFGKFEAFTLEFRGKITRLVGRNGAGKSMVGIKGLMGCINGIAESASGGRLQGERFRFIGKNGASADLAYTFEDTRDGSHFTIKNHVTKQANAITIKSDSESPIDDSLLKDFLRVELLSAKHFCSLSGQEQAKVLGIDTSSFDANIAKLKSEATLLRRDLKAFGELVAPEKVDRIDVKALIAEKEMVRKELNDKYLENKKRNSEMRAEFQKVCDAERIAIHNFNIAQKERAEKILSATDCADKLLDISYPGINGLREWINKLPIPEEQQDENDLKSEEPKYVEEMPDSAPLDATDAQITAANETNTKAEAYAQYLSRFAAKTAKEKEIKNNESEQDAEAKRRADYMSGMKFPFTGLTTDETGCLTLQGRPITESYFSKGELEMVVARLHASLNPNLKVRFIDEFDSLDDENQVKIVKELTEAGFYIITAEPRKGQEFDDENVIVLKECQIENAEEEQKVSLL